jgi:hypothetical protein
MTRSPAFGFPETDEFGADPAQDSGRIEAG